MLTYRLPHRTSSAELFAVIQMPTQEVRLRTQRQGDRCTV